MKLSSCLNPSQGNCSFPSLRKEPHTLLFRRVQNIRTIKRARKSATQQSKIVSQKITNRDKKSKETVPPSEKAEPTEHLPKTPVAVALEGDYEEEGNAKTLLVVNTNRSHSMQPTLRGMVKLGGKIIDIAAWWSETKDGTRDYYSLKYHDSVAAKEAWARSKSRVEPMGASKLYQFRARNESDPAYVSAEPFIVEGVPYWVLLWVVLPEKFPLLEEATEDDLRMIQYPFVFSRRRPEEKWQPGLAITIRSAGEHLLARRRELEKRNLLTDEDDPNDNIPY